jgi:hypothetical protein
VRGAPKEEKMNPFRKKALVAVLASIAMTFGVAATAGASLKPGTKVSASSKDVVFKGDINGVPITVTCTSFKDSGTVTSSDKTSMAVGAPSITGCKDSLGGKDTIKTSGSWKLTSNSSGSTVSLVIPKDGATFTSSVLSSCKIIAAPTGAVPVAGKYSSSKGTVTSTKAKIAVKGSGCTAASTTETATITLSPKPGKIPPFAS